MNFQMTPAATMLIARGRKITLFANDSYLTLSTRTATSSRSHNERCRVIYVLRSSVLLRCPLHGVADRRSSRWCSSPPGVAWGFSWWQWTRFESASGTFQNLGYAMQWPLFAGFCVYGYYKFVRYEDAPPRAEEPRRRHRDPCPPAAERPKPTPQSDDDPALREYNAYLADLAKKDKEQ